MPKYFIFPFGVSGDLTVIPDPAQPDGSVSYSQGFTNDYQLELGVDPTAKAIPRAQFNELMYDITTNIQQYQQASIPQFITALQNGGINFPYPKFARVLYDAGTGLGTRVYMSLIDSNNTLPTNTTNWLLERGPSSTILTSNGTFVVPSYVNIIYVTMIGGGAGGGGSGGSQNSSTSPRAAGGAAGGGSGSGIYFFPINVISGETLNIVVGAGGNGGAAGTNTIAGQIGMAGGDTQILRGASILVTAGGGQPGGGSIPANVSNLLSLPGSTSGTNAQNGQLGFIAFDTGSSLNEAFGGAGGLGGSSILGNITAGGISRRSTAGSPGSNASGYGNGGGGASGGSSTAGTASNVGAAGGNGSNGVVIINY